MTQALVSARNLQSVYFNTALLDAMQRRSAPAEVCEYIAKNFKFSIGEDIDVEQVTPLDLEITADAVSRELSNRASTLSFIDALSGGNRFYNAEGELDNLALAEGVIETWSETTLDAGAFAALQEAKNDPDRAEGIAEIKALPRLQLQVN